MRPTRLISPGTSPIEDLDAPAYTRGLTSLREFQGSQAIRAANRVDEGNRTFNQQFLATLASETGGVPSGIDTVRLGKWVSGILGGKKKAGGSPKGDVSGGVKPKTPA